MASPQQENDARAQLQGVLAELKVLTAGDLARTQQLGPDLSFESGVIYFSRVLRLFHALNDVDLTDVPYQKLTEILGVANQAKEQFNQIRQFSLQKYANNPIGTRDSLITQVRDSYDAIYAVVSSVIAFSIRKGTDFEKLEEQAKQALQRIDNVNKEHELALKTARDDAEKVLQEVRRIAQEAGVSQHAAYFKTEADHQEASAKPWLTATIALASVAALGSVVLLTRYFYYPVPTLTPSQSLQVAIPKVFLFSILLSATVWTGKTYRAYRHNAVINRHRQNALMTFRAFAEASSDDATKNSVLLQATKCIFSPQQTGYIQGEQEGSSMPQVLEIVRNLGK